MRAEFAQAMNYFFDRHPDMVFLTGDLGFMALEKVQQRFGNHFINAGLAEQNMVSLAAGLAYEGMKPWVYSIAPFVTLRPYEQIRNDVCIHNLPVKFVGNGGGYGYGIMGSTHHNLEDIGAMRVLPNMRVYVPFVASDVRTVVGLMLEDPNPNYLRLNLGARITQPVSSFEAWRNITRGSKAVVVGTGPVVENVLRLDPSIVEKLDVWVVSVFPLTSLPEKLLSRASTLRSIITIEEHYGQCGMHEALASKLLQTLTVPVRFSTLYASGYPSGKYGSQRWHQEENNLAGQGLVRKITEFLA
jgi:transketolase